LGAELDVVDVDPRTLDRRHGTIDALVPADPQLVNEVDLRRRNEDMDPRTLRTGQRRRRTVHVLLARTRQPGDHRTPDPAGDRTDRSVIVRRTDREARLDHVHAERIELMRKS